MERNLPTLESLLEEFKQDEGALGILGTVLVVLLVLIVLGFVVF